MSSMTQQELKQLLHYDPETGHFTWLASGPSIMNGWRGERAGTTRGGRSRPSKARRIYINAVMYSEAKLAWLYMTGEWPRFEVDHRNRDEGDNRWENLREATPSENTRNRGIFKNNTSGVTGVSLHKQSGKYHAYIRINYTLKSLGLHTKLEDAIEARKKAELYYFRDFAPSLIEARDE